jgi:protein-L-isoaspartate(D-aspartate) O-methyltransferase
MAEGEYEGARRRMVEHLRRQGVSEVVLGAMVRVKRHLFVPPNLSDQAYNDYPLPIGEGQTISAPHMVAMMCDYLDLREGNKVLEVGAGSGYHAAVIAEIIGEEGHVYTLVSCQLSSV